MKKIRILFTIPNFLTAGSGREMFNIIERLDKAMFEPYIAVRQAGGKLYEEILQKGYPVITEQFYIEEHQATAKKLIAAFRLSRIFKPYKFDIWQSFNWSSDYTEALVAKFSGAQYVYVKKNMNWNRLAWKVKSHIAGAIVARNSNLVDGPFSAKHLKQKTFFVPGGVSGDFAAFCESDIRSQIGIPPTATVICCVAQIVRTKDQATLVKAVIGMNNVYVVLAGADRDAEYAANLRKVIADNELDKRVFLTGAISSVRELLHASDIFVLPTTNKDGHEEGCPVALLEAMAAGVPCIASDVAGSRDLIKPHKTGLIFTPGSSEELAGCIEYYITNREKAKHLAHCARVMVETEYTLEKEAFAFSHIYREILKR